MAFMKDILTRNIPIWEECAATPFVQEVQTGKLPLEKFKRYMIQDSIYLKNYARIYGKAIFHADTLREIQLYYSMLNFVNDTESEVRLDYLKQFCMTDNDIELIAPLPENQNYIDFMFEIASHGKNEEILMAVLPCMLSYSYIFRKICCWEYLHLPLQKQYRHNRMVQIIWELAQCSLLELKPTLILYQWRNYRKSAQPFLCRSLLLAVSIKEIQGVSSPWELTGWLLYLPS